MFSPPSSTGDKVHKFGKFFHTDKDGIAGSIRGQVSDKIDSPASEAFGRDWQRGQLARGQLRGILSPLTHNTATNKHAHILY